MLLRYKATQHSCYSLITLPALLYSPLPTLAYLESEAHLLLCVLARPRGLAASTAASIAEAVGCSTKPVSRLLINTGRTHVLLLFFQHNNGLFKRQAAASFQKKYLTKCGGHKIND